MQCIVADAGLGMGNGNTGGWGGLQAVTEIKPGHTSVSGLDRFC